MTREFSTPGRGSRRRFGAAALLGSGAVAAAIAGAPQAAAESRRGDALRKALLADGPYPAYRKELDLYGQFVGSWDMIMTDLSSGESTPTAVHFGWILNGLGVGDVWVTKGSQTEIGTTIRMYRPDEGLWRLTWNPANDQLCVTATGTKVGDEIVQPSDYNAAGFPLVWVFSDITPTTFSWRAQSPAGTVYVTARATRTN